MTANIVGDPPSVSVLGDYKRKEELVDGHPKLSPKDIVKLTQKCVGLR